MEQSGSSLGSYPKGCWFKSNSRYNIGSMNTKRIGNIGEALAISEFVKRGIPVYIPFGENEKADLIADFNGKLNRIQCKTSDGCVKDGVIDWRLVTVTYHNVHRYTKSEVDYFALYNVKYNIHILIPFEDIKGRQSLYVSVDCKPPRNSKNPIIWKQYTFDKILGTQPEV